MGRRRPLQKVRYGRRLARDLDASIDEVAGGKHFVPEDHPDRVAAAIQKSHGNRAVSVRRESIGIVERHRAVGVQ